MNQIHQIKLTVMLIQLQYSHHQREDNNSGQGNAGTILLKLQMMDMSL